jgi:hypothetical protein
VTQLRVKIDRLEVCLTSANCFVAGVAHILIVYQGLQIIADWWCTNKQQRTGIKEWGAVLLVTREEGN